MCFQPAAAPDVLATSLGAHQIQLWGLALDGSSPDVPLGTLRAASGTPPVTCFGFDEEGSALVVADGAGGLSGYALPGCEETFSVAAHERPISLVTHFSAPLSAPSALLLTVAANEVKLWHAPPSACPACIGTLALDAPPSASPLLPAFDFASSTLLLASSPPAASTENSILALRVDRDATDAAASRLGATGLAHSEHGVLSFAPGPGAEPGSLDLYCVHVRRRLAPLPTARAAPRRLARPSSCRPPPCPPPPAPVSPGGSPCLPQPQGASSPTDSSRRARRRPP